MAVYAVLMAMLVWSDGFQPYHILYRCKVAETLNGMGTVTLLIYGMVCSPKKNGSQNDLFFCY